MRRQRNRGRSNWSPSTRQWPKAAACGRHLAYEPLESRQLLAREFDFGMLASPVDPLATRIDATPYSAALGYGWSAGTIWGADRAIGTDKSRDLNFTTDGTFEVDVPNGTYRVDAVLGDLGSFDHDGMLIYVEGKPLDVVSLLSGQSETASATTPVSDGRLTIRLRDLGGLDPNAAIQSLTVTAVAADTAGPAVTVRRAEGSATATPTVTSPINFEVVFSEPVTGFDAADVALLPGAAGATVQSVAGQGTTYNVLVGGMTGDGLVGFELASGAAVDFSGNASQVSNRATAVYTFAAAPLRFDFGPAGAAEAGWTRITESTAYAAGTPGWEAGTAASLSRQVGENPAQQARNRDFVFTADRTFAVDLAPGSYRIEVVMGDMGGYVHDEMQVSLDNIRPGWGEIPLDTVSTLPGELSVVTAVIGKTTAANVPLRIRVRDLGGIDPNAVVQSIVVAPVAADATPPVATIERSASQAASTGLASADFTVRFDEPVRNFTLADMLLGGTSGGVKLIAPGGLTGQGTLYNARVTGAVAPAGSITATFNPVVAVTDLSGNVVAVAPALASVDFTALAPLALIDFGTTAPSPVETGATAVNQNTVAGAGPGWVAGSGTVASADRQSGARTLLDRDLNFTSKARFRVPGLAPGNRIVDIVLGDRGAYAHDDMEILLNGLVQDIVSTARGEVRRVSYLVPVGVDGVLTIDLSDLGGEDANVAIQALEVR